MKRRKSSHRKDRPNAKRGDESGTAPGTRLGDAYDNMLSTLEALRKFLISDETVKYYLEQPDATLDNIFKVERNTLEQTLGHEAETIREAKNEMTQGLAHARGQGLFATLRVLNVLEFVALMLFKVRGELKSALEAVREDSGERLAELVKEFGRAHNLTDQEREAITQLSRHFENSENRNERKGEPTNNGV